MDLSMVIVFSFIGSTFMLYRFSRHSRFLTQSWKLSPEEMERYQTRARSALICAGILMAVCVFSIVVAAILYFVGF